MIFFKYVKVQTNTEEQNVYFLWIRRYINIYIEFQTPRVIFNETLSPQDTKCDLFGWNSNALRMSFILQN